MANVSLQHITKRFQSVTALQDISLDIKDGEFFVLLGPTGAGKTTTLRIIAGLERQDEGVVCFDDQSVDHCSPAERDISFVFQQYSLYPTMSVYDNLAFPLRSPLRKTPEDEIKRKVSEVAAKLRISHLLERKTGHLSGGEMQRVSIGRAIVRDPRIFLMDEPLSNLDAKLRESLRVELERIQKTRHSTTLYVTHDQVEALTLADRIAVMDSGHIVQIGTSQDIYDRPATLFVAQLVGTPRINLFALDIDNSAVSIRQSAIRLQATRQLNSGNSTPHWLGVRAEDVILNHHGQFSGTISLIEPLGAETILHVTVGNLSLLSMTSGLSQHRIGEQIRFDFNQECLHFFDQNGQRV